MQILDSINNKNKQETIIKSIIWKTIIDIFIDEKKMDISNYLVSIKFIGDIIFIKVTKPIIAVELNLLNEKIKKSSLEKLKRLGLKNNFIEIKYK